MPKPFAITFVIGLVSMAFAMETRAAPLSSLKSIQAENGVTLVRDGCGRGMRYSRSRRACVPDRHSRPVVVVPQRDRHRDRHRNNDAAAAAAVVGTVLGIIGSSAARNSRDCPRGMRFSSRRGACVPR